MPTYDPYTSLLDSSEIITTQKHSIGNPHHHSPIPKAHRPTLCHLPRMSPQTLPTFPKSYEQGIDRWDGPLWPHQDHAGLLEGETEVLPHDYTVANSHINEITGNEITSYEQGIDRWDGPLWPGQDHSGLREGETEVLPHDYKVVDSHINEIKGYEEGIDRWDGPLWPGQDHAGLRQGETEVLPKRYRVAKGGELILSKGKDVPKLEIEIEILGYEDGIDGWDGPMWPGQDHAGLWEGETEVLPEVYHVSPGLKL